MTARHTGRGYALAITLGVIGVVVGVVLLLAGPASAHSGQATFTAAKCVDGVAWGADLTITANVVELDPVATITGPASPFHVHVGARWSTRMTTNDPTLTVGIVLVWSDGFTQNLGSFTASRPTDCTSPTSQVWAPAPGGPSTTVTTTAPPSTTAAPPSTTAPVEATTAAPPATSIHQAPPRQASRPPAPPTLPVTGATMNAIVALGVALALVGALALVARRRRSPR